MLAPRATIVTLWRGANARKKIFQRAENRDALHHGGRRLLELERDEIRMRVVANGGQTYCAPHAHRVCRVHREPIA